ncbi:hypothetical protein [Paraliomyxa miuraensis]|uniref:hypothetical protein n=1 Tax=Paraliomyxa miuraensis TaxID=376150 RepID=UPI0022539316|nr:hypothetical protein [Paraliomyxa miuraensis]MCX4245291.1 hypothetical protein [Paraliomyxa miuraensis]
MMRRFLALSLVCAACFNPGSTETTDPTFGPVDPSTTGVSTSSNDEADSSGELPASCSDGAQGGDETDVDCGGSCAPCGDGQGCIAGDDCSSGICQNQVCLGGSCGDGIVQEGEECDEGGPSPTCTAQCTMSGCGDGVLSGDEDCDDGGESATCNADCTVAACGDGVVNATAGETCDDQGETATCNADCTAAACGDGQLNLTAGEECDEGGDTATCDGDCTAPSCGDGYANVALAEECDDAGESAACDDDCTLAVCGDDTVNATAGEECEGGPAALCTAQCLYSDCAPDPVAAAMAACMAQWPNCSVQNGGIVGYGPGQSPGSNCGPPSNEWRWYCTANDPAGTNYNCSACTIGEILGPHDPCSCNPGTCPVLGMFCMP